MVNLPQLDPIYYNIPMLKGINMVGKRFNKWLITEDLGLDFNSDKIVRCKCECGFERINKFYLLKKNMSTQCKNCSLKKINNFPDLTGQTINKWLVVRRINNDNKNQIRYLCKCECGTEKSVVAYRLRNKQSGCCPHCRVKTHGMSYTDTFRIWTGILRRCFNKNFKNYKYYGGRGITVCDRWLKFENFFIDMGIRPEKLQIDRIDNNGNYEPGNCRWVTAKVNSANKNRTIIAEGK